MTNKTFFLKSKKYVRKNKIVSFKSICADVDRLQSDANKLGGVVKSYIDELKRKIDNIKNSERHISQYDD
jgi:hypothetical protein